jgi:hypothetical protein
MFKKGSMKRTIVLRRGEYAVVLAERSTGIVLSTGGAWAVGDEERYHVFHSIDAAREFVTRTIAADPTREGVVLDHEGNAVEVHTQA